MSQHDFNIANQSFPATRTDLNNALTALASNSSGATAPTTTYANQFWYDTSTNILYIRNEANNGWVSVITLDASMTATASELNQLDAITRGSILYGNASGETARLAAGAASTVLTSDGTDISWAAAAGGGGGGMEFIASSGAISDGTASVAFTGFDASKYDHYVFYFQHLIPATDGGGDYILGRLSANGGSSYDATDGNYHYSSSTDRTGFLIINEAIGSDTNEYGFSGMFKVFCPHVAAYTYGKQDGVGMTTTSGNLASASNSNIHLSAAAQNAIQFLFNSGNIESGEITMFGIVNS